MQPADVHAREADEAQDQALMARVQAGDEAAFATLMERWERPTRAVIGRIVLNAAEADELAQEAFVRVWLKRDKFNAGANFRPWLFAIAVNLARNRLRWWRRQPVVSLDEWDKPSAADEHSHRKLRPSDALAAERNTAASIMEHSERAAAVRDAVAALPPDLRVAVVLFEFEQMSHAEIAATVGATAKAVETRIYRAKEKLRTMLRKWA